MWPGLAKPVWACLGLPVGGPSGPKLFSQLAAIWNNSVGPEGPPATAKR
ncbi:DUF6053 domain-containing protein [Lysobacter enzymogenes]